MMSPRRTAFFTIMLAINSLGAIHAKEVSAMPAPAIEDKVQDVFVPSSYENRAFEGYLAERMRINVEKRLLTLNEESILEPYKQRPGAQEWAGEHVGKFLHAASLAWQATGDERLKQKMDKVARQIIACQLPDGYLGTYLEAKRWTSWDVWSHKYNMIGLLAYYQATGYEPALDSCRGMADLLCATFGPGKRDIIAAGEHVGMAATSVLEPMAGLYRQTGDPRYLAFCEYIVQSWEQPNGPKILTSLLHGGSVRKTANAKAYEMLSNLVGLLELYRLTQREDYLEACTIAWQDIKANQLFVTGTTSYGEHFQEDRDPPDGGRHPESEFDLAGEGCVTVTWLQLNWHLLRLTGQARYATELERTTFNALAGAQSPLTGAVCYFIPINGCKPYGKINHGILPDISCCSSSIPRGLAMIPRFLVGTLAGSPSVLIPAPGRYAMAAQTEQGAVGVGLSVKTEYPAQGAVEIAVAPSRDATFALTLRVPEGSGGFTARVGNQSWTGKAGEFLAIRRAWTRGDVVRISMDLPLRLAPYREGRADKVCIVRGPQVLAVDQNIEQIRQLPGGWFGRQIYTVKAVQREQVREFVMVPFAEAGQTMAGYQAALERMELPSEGESGGGGGS